MEIIIQNLCQNVDQVPFFIHIINAIKYVTCTREQNLLFIANLNETFFINLNKNYEKTIKNIKFHNTKNFHSKYLKKSWTLVPDNYYVSIFYRILYMYVRTHVCEYVKGNVRKQNHM